MPKVMNPDISYMNVEGFGKWNTGKSYLGYSVCELPLIKQFPDKTEIIVFSNESNFAKTLEQFPEHRHRFTVFQHRTLEEFESDWGEFCDEYGVGLKQVGNKQVLATGDVEKRVFAIIIDEAEFLYREGYIIRHEEKFTDKGLKWKPKDYGKPRRDFLQMFLRIGSLPCHFIVLSKVGNEYESYRDTKVSGELGSLQFRKTGVDTYRLPENYLYFPATSVYLFERSEILYQEDGKTPQADELGRPISEYTHWGDVRKQKADRSQQLLIRAPTMLKLKMKLTMLRNQAIKRRQGK